jgi:hypothetical protein
LLISAELAAVVAFAQTDKPALTCSTHRGNTSNPTLDLDVENATPLSTELGRFGNWQVSTVVHNYDLDQHSVDAQDKGAGVFTVRITPTTPVDFTKGAALVRFASPAGNLEATCKPEEIKGSSWLPSFVEDPKDADITIAGALQTTVGDKPQYNYSIDGKYDILSKGPHAISATFKAIASQEHNADPDSMKLAANYRWLIELPRKWQMIVSSDLIAYEFERKVKDDKPVALNQPIPKFIDKNSNRVHSAQVTFIRSTKYGSFFFRPVGIEGGSYITRSVHATSNTGQDTAILRGAFGADYYTFWKDKAHIHRIDFEAHHTQRILHFAEPYTRADLNGGDQYLSRYARPISTAKLTFTLVDGFGVSSAYLRGSLPPTFEFVDHQLTIGLTVLLQRK